MPELPEVEHARIHLERRLRRHAVVDARAKRTRVFRGADMGAFQRLRGKVLRVRRHWKVLFVECAE